MSVTTVPEIFRVFNAAIKHAYLEGDDRTVDLLLAAKYAAVLRHHAVLEERR